MRFDVASGRGELFVVPTARTGSAASSGGGIALTADGTAWVSQPQLGIVTTKLTGAGSKVFAVPVSAKVRRALRQRNAGASRW